MGRGSTRVVVVVGVGCLLAAACRGGGSLPPPSAAGSTAGGGAASAGSSPASAAAGGVNWRLPATLPTFPSRGGPAPLSPVAAPQAPAEAVTRFVAAQAGGDFDTAWGLLSSTDRAKMTTAASWRAAQRQLPTFVSVALDAPAAPSAASGGAAGVAGTMVLTGIVVFRPGLDEVRGLTPARAKAAWTLAAEDGGWRVTYSASTFQAVFAVDASGAADAVIRWATERRRNGCRRGPDEWSGGLVGVPGLAKRLCSAKGELGVGTATAFDVAADGAPVVAAFGPDALAWARVVPVRAPVAMRAVVAPVGDRWLVIGALMP